MSIVGKWQVSDGDYIYFYEFYANGTFKSNAFSSWASVSGRYTLDGANLYVTATNGFAGMRDITAHEPVQESINERATFTVVIGAGSLELAYNGGSLVTRTLLTLTRNVETSQAPQVLQAQQQAQQQAQPYPAYNPYTKNPYMTAQPGKKAATASLILGICSIVFSGFGLLGILAVIGLVLAISAKSKGNRSATPTVGLLLSIFGMLLNGVFFIVCAVPFCVGCTEALTQAL